MSIACVLLQVGPASVDDSFSFLNIEAIKPEADRNGKKRLY